MSAPPRWTAYSASAPGTSHLRRGAGGQDQVCYREEPGFLVAVVADGAGSAANSALGALAATRQALTVATWEMLQARGRPGREELGGILRRAAASARQSLERMAGESSERLNSYACTLLLTVQTAELLGGAQIGDGGIVVSDGQGGFDCFTAPQKGEYANQTIFLTSARGLEQMEVRVEEAQPEKLAMFTDGIQNLVIESATQRPFQPFFTSIFGWLENQTDRNQAETDLANLLRSPRVTAKTDDDTTLLLAMRR